MGNNGGNVDRLTVLDLISLLKTAHSDLSDKDDFEECIDELCDIGMEWCFEHLVMDEKRRQALRNIEIMRGWMMAVIQSSTKQPDILIKHTIDF